MEPLARTERQELCNAALSIGPDADTLCGGWSVRDLIVHLLVRERDPLGAPGIVVPQLEGLTALSERRLAKQDFTSLVERVRSGPPVWSPMRLGVLDRNVNTMEYFIHHEDIRRAQPGWEPRDLDERTERTVWKAIGVGGRALVRPAKVPVVIEWAGTDRRQTLRNGDDPVVVRAEPAELALVLFGRDRVRGVEYAGPPDRIARFTEAKLGL